MGVNSLLKTVTRQRRDCDLNPGPSAPESSTLTTRLPSQQCTRANTVNPNNTKSRISYTEGLHDGQLPYATRTFILFQMCGRTHIRNEKNECCKNHLFCFILFHVICADGIICFEKRQ